MTRFELENMTMSCFSQKLCRFHLILFHISVIVIVFVHQTQFYNTSIYSHTPCSFQGLDTLAVVSRLRILTKVCGLSGPKESAAV